MKDKMRKETTEFLSSVLIADKLSGFGKHYAREVSIDWGTEKERRIDYMLFEPAAGYHVGGIEKGTFTCFEIKSCRSDVFSGNGLNFFGEKNYIVTTMQCWKEIISEFRSGLLLRYIHEYFPDSSQYFGIMVAIPIGSDEKEEFFNPTPIDSMDSALWQLKTIHPCRIGPRTKSMSELLFCMLRSGR